MARVLAVFERPLDPRGYADSGADGTALDLNVQPGEQPMTVGSQANNLDADRQDGQNVSAFG
jgi:hypothetical protein